MLTVNYILVTDCEYYTANRDENYKKGNRSG